MDSNSTPTGIGLLGMLAWGSHFCYFYETQDDLLRTLVPYFQTGLENNEYCLWIVSKSELLTTMNAKASLRRVVPDLDRHLSERRIEILDHDEWFAKVGSFDIQTVVGQLLEKLKQAEARGYAGMRVNGGSAWLLKQDRREFREFEQEIDKTIAGQRMIVLCTFPLVVVGASDILDAARTHQSAMALRRGNWEIIESPERAKRLSAEIKAVKPKGRKEPDLELLTPRQREVLSLTAQGFSMKEVALMLDVSVKTIEAHRLNLMHRLDIHNVPSLVHFSIKAGLINLED